VHCFKRCLSVICQNHIYDTSDYGNSFVADSDFGNCGKDFDPDWPLHPVISRASLLGTGLAFGQILGTAIIFKKNDDDIYF